jgi:hypothetical protein
VQLVVDRAQLLVGRLQLLVHRLQLFVRRLQLLGGRLQLLVRALELLLERLCLREVDEGDAGAAHIAALVEDRHGLHFQLDALARTCGPRRIADQHRVARRIRFVDRRPQVDRPIRHLQILQQPPEVDGASLLVATAGIPLVRPGGRVDGQQAIAQAAVRRALEDPPPEVHRPEAVAVRQQRFGLAEEDVAVLRHREVEAGKDPGLGLDVEVHQRVAADQQIDPRDRRVLHQVVAAEDQRSPQIRAKDVPPAHRLEIARQLLRRQPGDLAVVVARRPRLGERLLVGVGGVDLHPALSSITRGRMVSAM